MVRECHFSQRPWCSYCQLNTHATEDYPELVVRWEEQNWAKGVNLVCVEAQDSSPSTQPNINVVTRGGKKMRADIGTPDQLAVKRPASPKKSYDPNKQKEYYWDATKLFC